MTCHALSVLMWPKPSGILPCAPPGSGGPSRTMPGDRDARGPGAGPPAHPECAGSHRRPGAGRPGRLGGGGPACRGRAPAAGPGCCARHGPLATTEALDARALAHCADVIRPTPRPLPDAQTQELRALLGRRQPLIGMRTAAQHRLAGTSARLTKDIAAHMTWLNAGIATLDDDLETLLRASPLWREQRRSVAECPGHWARVCPHVAAGTPRVGDAHAAADRGLGRRGAAQWRQWDPPRSAHDLGRARACAHRVLHGHAVATRSNPQITAFYERLLAAGNVKKVALTACMHKFLTILNAC